MIVTKYYDFRHAEERFTKISNVTVRYFDNDITEMTGHFFSDDIIEIARILKQHYKALKLIEVMRI